MTVLPGLKVLFCAEENDLGLSKGDQSYWRAAVIIITAFILTTNLAAVVCVCVCQCVCKI